MHDTASCGKVLDDRSEAGKNPRDLPREENTKNLGEPFKRRDSYGKNQAGLVPSFLGLMSLRSVRRNRAQVASPQALVPQHRPERLGVLVLVYTLGLLRAAVIPRPQALPQTHFSSVPVRAARWLAGCCSSGFSRLSRASGPVQRHVLSPTSSLFSTRPIPYPRRLASAPTGRVPRRDYLLGVPVDLGNGLAFSKLACGEHLVVRELQGYTDTRYICAKAGRSRDIHVAEPAQRSDVMIGQNMRNVTVLDFKSGAALRWLGLPKG
ncbi:hypothetical protein EDB84DRAFT_1441104 [Lactarius hengduanensis]|nr:hypothetical protein EDB84DRAFT_1441104 [Lactarius hengduanensis]